MVRLLSFCFEFNKSVAVAHIFVLEYDIMVYILLQLDIFFRNALLLDEDEKRYYATLMSPYNNVGFSRVNVAF